MITEMFRSSGLYLDCSETLSELIARGNFTAVDHDIHEGNFPRIESASMAFEAAFYVHEDGLWGDPDLTVIQEDGEQPWQHATLRMGLTFLRAYQNLPSGEDSPHGSPILFNGSRVRLPNDDYDRKAIVYGYHYQRKLDLNFACARAAASVRHLIVRKYV